MPGIMSQTPELQSSNPELQTRNSPDPNLRPFNAGQVLKIDTEGSEVEVLAGARNLLKAGKIDSLIVELTPNHWLEPQNQKLPLPSCPLLLKCRSLYLESRVQGPESKL